MGAGRGRRAGGDGQRAAAAAGGDRRRRRPTCRRSASPRSPARPPGAARRRLPGHDAEREWRWLSERSFVEPVGEGVALHALLREAVRADLRRASRCSSRPKRRIADHVYAVAVRAASSAGRSSSPTDRRPRPALGLRLGGLGPALRRHPAPGDAVEIDAAEADPGDGPALAEGGDGGAGRGRRRADPGLHLRAHSQRRGRRAGSEPAVRPAARPRSPTHAARRGGDHARRHRPRPATRSRGSSGCSPTRRCCALRAPIRAART